MYSLPGCMGRVSSLVPCASRRDRVTDGLWQTRHRTGRTWYDQLTAYHQRLNGYVDSPREPLLYRELPRVGGDARRSRIAYHTRPSRTRMLCRPRTSVS